MEFQFSLVSSSQLIDMYHEKDRELKKRLIEGDSWEHLKEKVDYIIEISKELTRREAELPKFNSTPADAQMRKE